MSYPRLKAPNLPWLTISPEWQPDAFENYRHNTEKLKRFADNAVRCCNRYQERLRVLMPLGIEKNISALIKNIRSVIDALVFCDLLNTNNNFFKSVGLHKGCLTALYRGEDSLSTQVLKSLIRLYFEKYSQIIEHENFDFFQDLIKNELLKRKKQYARSNRQNAFAKLCNAASLFFKKTAVFEVVKRAKRDFGDFEDLVSHYALDRYRSSDYVQQCRYGYYISTLKEIPLGEHHHILDLIIAYKERQLAVGKLGPCLGHAAIRILVDRCKGQMISQTWLNFILSIAHDPRLPKNSAAYRQWWGELGPEYADQVQSWLSTFDLNLFLDLLEECASENYDMERMFPARKEFIEKLLKLGCITQTRLLLSKEAVDFVNFKYNYKIPSWLNFVRVTKSKKTSFIFLNLLNQVYMMEGTHTCTLRMVDQISPESMILNYECKEIPDDYCRTGFKYYNAPSYADSFERTHNGSWQWSASKFLIKHGIPIEL